LFLARVYEARNEAAKRIASNEWREPQNNRLQLRLAMPIKKLMADELRERQEKGPCFKCSANTAQVIAANVSLW
jgi:hypothetical protein